MNRLLMSSLATLLVTACAHTGPSMSSADRLALYQANAGEPVTSFQHSQNLRWSALGDQALAVWSRRNQAYLVELRSSCQGLSSTPSISISNTGGITRRVSTFDSVRVTRPGGVVSQPPCRIQSIRPLDVKALANDKQELLDAETVDREPEPGEE